MKKWRVLLEALVAAMVATGCASTTPGSVKHIAPDYRTVGIPLSPLTIAVPEWRERDEIWVDRSSQAPLAFSYTAQLSLRHLGAVLGWHSLSTLHCVVVREGIETYAGRLSESYRSMSRPAGLNKPKDQPRGFGVDDVRLKPLVRDVAYDNYHERMRYYMYPIGSNVTFAVTCWTTSSDETVVHHADQIFKEVVDSIRLGEVEPAKQR